MWCNCFEVDIAHMVTFVLRKETPVQNFDFQMKFRSCLIYLKFCSLDSTAVAIK